MLTSAIYKALVLPESRLPEGMQPPFVRELTTIEQVTRFLIVGGGSFLIDTTIKYTLMRWIHVGGEPLGMVAGRWLQADLPSLFGKFSSPDKAAASVAGGIATFVAILNSFIWNRAWTFEAKGRERRSVQIFRFYLVAIIGGILTNVLFTGFYSLASSPNQRTIFFATAAASAIAAIWNYFGQRYFAFRARNP
jgi:putative flippase GtrA